MYKWEVGSKPIRCVNRLLEVLVSHFPLTHSYSMMYVVWYPNPPWNDVSCCRNGAQMSGWVWTEVGTILYDLRFDQLILTTQSNHLTLLLLGPIVQKKMFTWIFKAVLAPRVLYLRVRVMREKQENISASALKKISDIRNGCNIL